MQYIKIHTGEIRDTADHLFVGKIAFDSGNVVGAVGTDDLGQGFNNIP